jgi:hypothetical protein
MDHVERLLAVRELRAIVEVWCGVVSSLYDWEGSSAGGDSRSETLCELAVRGGGLLRSFRVSKGKSKRKRRVVDVLQSGVRIEEEE